MRRTACTVFSLIMVAIITVCSITAHAADYSYDALNRLTHVAYDNGKSVDFTYDAGGNITQVTKVGDFVAPSIPTGLAATTPSATQVDLAWTAATDNVAVTGYKIYRDSVLIGSFTGTGYSDTGLTAATLYSYTVAACDATAKCSAQSAAATATTKSNQSISFGTAPSVVVGGSGTVSATATSGLTVSFTTTTPGVCTVSGTTVAGLSVGTCTIAADQTGDSNYSAAMLVFQNITIIKAIATVTLSNLVHLADGTPKSATAFTTPGGLSVAITYNGSPAAPSAAGSYSVVATIVDANYQGSAAATMIISDTDKPVIGTFTVPASSASLVVDGIVLTASDNIAVTGYFISAAATTPALTDPAWSATSPTSLTFASVGSKTLYAFAKDASGNISGPATAGVIVDGTPPTLVISTLADGAITNNNTLNINGTTTDDGGIASLTINTGTITVNSDGSFSHALTLAEGDNQVTTIATDNAGNYSSDQRTIKLDLAAPKLIVLTPADNSKTAQLLATVTGTVDETSTVVISSGANYSQNATMDGNSYSASVTLANGLNRIDVIATDLAGNTSNAKVSVTYEPLKPSLAVTSPAQDVTVYDGKITISGTADGTISGIAALKISADGKEYHPQVTGGSFSQALTFTEEKLYPVIVTATDEAGNSESVTRNIIYAKGKIIINGGALYTITPKVILTLGYFAPSPAKMQLLYSNHWTRPATFADRETINLPDSNGKKIVSVRYLDATGNKLGEYSASITLDTKAPTGTMKINNGAEKTSSRNVTLAITATDNLSGIAKMCIKENTRSCADADFIPYAASLAYSITSEHDGLKNVYVILRDLAGKSSKLQASIKLETETQGNNAQQP